MGTTKLTRKEILAEDPFHAAIIRLLEFFSRNRRLISVAVAVAIVLIVGGYFGLKYLGKRETAAQGQLAKAMSFYHGAVDPEATDDPFSKGAVPTFKSDADKYRAAAKEFSDIASGWGFDKVSIVAKYYLGLCQLQLGDKQEAAANLQSVANNSRQRTIGFLAKKVLAAHYLEEGNHANAQDILQGMIKDPQCDLPKEDLAIQLSQALAAQGKHDEAVKVLRDASTEGAEFSTLKQRLVTELDRLQKASGTGRQP